MSRKMIRDATNPLEVWMSCNADDACTRQRTKLLILEL